MITMAALLALFAAAGAGDTTMAPTTAADTTVRAPAIADTAARAPAAADTTVRAPVARPRRATRSAEHDTLGLPKPVRRFEEIVVRSTPLHDLLSSETVQRTDRATLELLPVHSLVEALGLKAGVVATGEALHVRGGRAGDLDQSLYGISLREPFRGHPLPVPLGALRSVDLVTGAPDPEHAGSLAGTVVLSTVDPPERLGGNLRWVTDGRKDTRFDRVSGTLGGPLAGTGLGWTAAAEAQLDDRPLPSLRHYGRRDVLGGSFGWRGDNRLLGYLKLAPAGSDPRLSLDVLVARRIEHPYDPMWSLDGWFIQCVDPPLCTDISFSPTPVPGAFRYRAADHMTLEDTRSAAVVVSGWQPAAGGRVRASGGWIGTRDLISLGGHDDASYLVPERYPTFGTTDSPYSDPFYIYYGDEPYFSRATSRVFEGRLDYSRATGRGNRLGGGIGVTHTRVSKWEVDYSTAGLYVDSLRTYLASSPEFFAYGQGRWEFQGLVANGGVRAQYFAPGEESPGAPDAPKGRGLVSLAPRLGVAFPVSDRDVLSLAYTRVDQAPPRDALYESRVKIANRQPLGNNTLEPSTVISYQIALKRLLTEAWAVQVGMFYRDLFGQVGTRWDPDARAPRYSNEDYGSAQGYELSVIHREADRTMEIHYTFSHANGTGSTEEGVPYGTRIGQRPAPIGEHALDWDRRHVLSFAGARQRPGRWSAVWVTRMGSGLPWTPRDLRQHDPDFSRINSRRFTWEETTDLSVRLHPPKRWLRRFEFGFEARNLFDSRGESAATVDGFPQPVINTYYDDYGAFREASGLPGGAYWNDRDGDGYPGWVRVHDPRLALAPRTLRLVLAMRL